MFKRKKEISALDLLKEINDYKRSKEPSGNKTDLYDVKTLDIRDYKNPGKKKYNTKTMKTYNTTLKDFYEVKKKKNKGRFDLGSHRNKDIFIEVDSDQYDPGYNTKDFFINKCSKLLIDKVTPYVSDNYLTQPNINPYYKIKTEKNYNIKKPFQNNKKNKKNKNDEIIPNNKSHNIIRSNNLSTSSNDLIKYPFVISLKNKNTNKVHNTNLSNYLYDEMNDNNCINISNYSDNSGEKEERNIRNSNENSREKIFIDKNDDDMEPDYKTLYYMKKQEYNSLLNEYNDILNELNKYKNNNNYMINNFKKLNINRINNNKNKKNIIDNNKNLKEEQNIDIFISANFKQINDKEIKENNQYIISEENNIILISKYNNKCFNQEKLIINKIKDFKIINDKIVKNSFNSNNNLKKENNLNINLINKNNQKIIKFENKNIISFCLEGNKSNNNINNDKIKEKEKMSNNISIDLNDILDEINKNNSTKLKKNNNKKYNLKKFINGKNNKKPKEEIIEDNIERIINGNKNNSEDILENNILKLNNYPKKENEFINEEINDLPDLSYIRNKLNISIVKRMKINEDELN